MCRCRMLSMEVESEDQLRRATEMLMCNSRAKQAPATFLSCEDYLYMQGARLQKYGNFLNSVMHF